MTEVAMNHLFSRLKARGLIADDIAPHGLRSTASTIMNEHDISPDVVEIILAHNEKSSVRARYNHATHAAAAAKALQWYADYIDQLADGNVVDMTGQKLA
jgi:integrase